MALARDGYLVREHPAVFLDDAVALAERSPSRGGLAAAAQAFAGQTARRGRSSSTFSAMYAIAFDMDTDAMREHLGPSYANGYREIGRILARHGFDWQQGSVYFGNDQINAVTAVLATQEVAASLGWFAACVRDIRLLRIEDMNDLKPAVLAALPKPN